MNKAICDTVAKMAGLASGDRTFRIRYEISPSAEKSGGFVVNGDADDARTFARDEIGNIVAHQLASEAAERDANEGEKKEQRLLALVTPKWLIGTWIGTGADPASCTDGNSMSFRPGHRFSGGYATGQWSLAGDKLHIVGRNPHGPIDLSNTISAADAISMTLIGPDGSPSDLRRCSPTEEQTVIRSMNSTEGMDTMSDADAQAFLNSLAARH